MKDKSTAAILALFLGTIGVHKFYLGRIGAGIAYFIFSFTFIPAILGVIDFFVLALMDNDEFNRRYNGTALGPGVVVNMLPPHAYPPGYPPPGYPPPAGYPYPPPYPPQPMHHPHGGYPPAPQAQPQPQPQPQVRTMEELAQQLERLNELRIAGLLTDDEFAQQKARLLASMG